MNDTLQATPAESAVTRADFDQLLVPVYAPSQLVPRSARGLWLQDAAGTEYLDLTSGIGVTSLGHGHPAVLQALQAQAAQLWHVGNGYTNEPVLRLARLLTQHTFADRAFFCNSGAEANEAALKLARRHAALRHGAARRRIVACQQSFHGRTLFTVTAGGQPKYTEGFEPLPPDIGHIPFNDIPAAERAIGENVCAVIVEPVQGEGGVVPATRDYLLALREFCDRVGALLIFDEVQCGLGRTGELYAYMGYGVEPDILTTAKALGNGYPVGAMLTREAVAASLTAGTHGTTYGGNPLAGAVAGAVVQIIAQPAFLARVREASARLQAGLQGLMREFPGLFTEVRGAGLMLGLVLAEAHRGRARDFTRAAELERLMLLIAGPDVVRLLPALVISDAEIDAALQRLRATARRFLAPAA
ncbi:acetylornithine/succinyldiaminopimelate transaminase [Aquabacterium sp. A7-Y]|uniref:acetylornithine/succinyldiaminopimelate transaminase n=1 Tax=Aquabacterium sp. A7-Y TaxID=1349605 RepID=UPI00223D7065|nr:acetylornithine/succinyldiaminopimelate transaminase [Aquabacterium sp. A7-Y]MCW7539761.1 acetylornithine/succinyldiaminopimelate transaminase [Aquabacterium sp. A7-Y]